MKRIFILFSFVFIGMSLTAQDVHFSQYYASPLTLNPALTGKFDGLYRVTGIYRDQWRNVSATFMTPSVSLDFSLLKNKLKNGALGVGAVVTYDKAIATSKGGSLTNLDAALSLAYHLGLDKNNKYHIGLGLQGIYTNKSINSDFTFEEELFATPTYLDDANLNATPQHIFDMGAGIFLDGKITKTTTMFLGYSANHLLTPKDDFIADSSSVSKTPMRHVANIGAEIELTKFIFMPGALFQTTASANEINFGLTGGYKLIDKPGKNTKLFLGLWSRIHASKGISSFALIPKLGVDFENFRVSGAYDIGLGTMSKDSKSATNVNRIPTSFEIALNYFGQGTTPKPTNTFLFNPRF